MSKPLQTKRLNWKHDIEVVVDSRQPFISESVALERPHIFAFQPHQDNLLGPLEEPACEGTPDIANTTTVGLRSSAWIPQHFMNVTAKLCHERHVLNKDHQNSYCPHARILHCSQNKHQTSYSRHWCKQPHENIEPSQVTAAAPAALALIVAVLIIGVAEDDIEPPMPQSNNFNSHMSKDLPNNKSSHL